MKFQIQLWILLSSFCFISSIPLCDVSECECTENTIACRDNDPQWYQIEENIIYEYLDFRFCSIRYLKPEFFKKFKNLKELNIKNQMKEFNCTSIPKSPAYKIKTDCEFPKTSTVKPDKTTNFISTTKRTSTILTTLQISTRRELSSKTDIIKTTSGSPTEKIICSTLFSTDDPVLSTSTSELSQTTTETTAKKTSSEIGTKLNTETSTDLILKTGFSLSSDETTQIKEHTTKNNKLAEANIDPWLIVAIIFILSTLGIIFLILCVIFLKRRRINNQINTRRSNPIYMGDLSETDFSPFPSQMSLHCDEPDDEAQNEESDI